MHIFSNLSETTTKYIFLALVMAVFYFFIIRPNQQEETKKKKFIETLKKGKKVVTIGGLHGTVVDVDEETVVLEIDKKGSKITVSKKAIAS